MSAPDWNHLVSAFLDGTLDAEGHERLKALCKDDPAREDELVRAMLAERLLPLAVDPHAGERTAEEVLFRIHPEISEIPRFTKVRTRFDFRRVIIPAAAAIVIGAAGWFAFERTRPMGYLSRTESLVWSDGDAVRKDGKLSRGRTLKASSGLAEIQLRNGARLVLEAPFSLDLTSYKSVSLNTGRLAARCPPSAHGFTIETPRGKVTDLGTELGVHVEEDGSVEAHVLTGSVEIDSKASHERMSLFDGEAVRMDASETHRIVADPSAFVTQMPLPESLPGFVHWDMDENHGATAADTGHGLTGSTDGSLALAADPTENPAAKPPEWINGVRGSGLSFDGIGSYAESTYRGIEGASPRSVAMWIRVPDTELHAGAGILSWGSAMEDSAWQISINWIKEDGPTGRLRLGTYAGRIVGTTPLQDGNWHHIAVVMYPQPHPDAAVNVLLYVDGKLEPIAHRSNFRVDTNIRQAAHGVSLGRHVSPINHTRKFFHGEMDDVFIFGRPLLQEQILRLMDGRPDMP